jgi:tetratricopeptide (TPR) repeat protein
MSFCVGSKQYSGPEECLRDVMRMIRTGLSPNEPVATQKARTRETIASLKSELRRANVLNPADTLRFTTLEAEFYQQCGLHAKSRELLKPTWDNLETRLRQWSTKSPLQDKPDRALLRQKIWALLHYAFYDYRVTGNHKEALDRFLSIERVINGELQNRDYTPFGTRALFSYFIGHCYRVDRGFAEAERRLLDAQRYTLDRVKREMDRKDTTADRKRYELNYKDLFCARILSGQAWIEMQQGHLTRAQQTLWTAQNCLMQSRQETIAVYIDSLLCMAVRRKTPYSSPAYQEALGNLAKAHENARGVHELIRQRCAFELVRGYLDFAEFGTTEKDLRKDYVSEARQWLDKIGEMPIPKSEYRYLLHETRLFLVKGDIELAEAHLNRLRSASQNPRSPRQRAFYIMEASIYFAQHDLDNAANAIQRALKEILPLSESAQIREYRVPDPVLEAECYVLLARISSARKDYATTMHYLERWRLLSQFVENYYLHHLAKVVSTTEGPFFLAHNYPIYKDADKVDRTIIERRDDFERWLVRNARERHPELRPGAFAKIYGLDRSVLVRKFP